MTIPSANNSNLYPELHRQINYQTRQIKKTQGRKDCNISTFEGTGQPHWLLPTKIRPFWQESLLPKPQNETNLEA